LEDLKVSINDLNQTTSTVSTPSSHCKQKQKDKKWERTRRIGIEKNLNKELEGVRGIEEKTGEEGRNDLRLIFRLAIAAIRLGVGDVMSKLQTKPRQTKMRRKTQGNE
jgi:hypothetical protein